MNWYYAERGQHIGPVTDVRLLELFNAGTIKAGTLVWHDGLPDWVPYRQAMANAPVIPSPLKPPTGLEAVCSHCGKMFPIHTTTRYGDERICSLCKTVFLQKRQGVSTESSGMNYASFFIRFAAVLIDGLILFATIMILGFILGVFLGLFMRGRDPSAILIVSQAILMVAGLGIGIVYESIMIGKYGATLGKMALKLKVVTADGNPVSYGRAFGRYFAKILSGLPCLIGYLIAFFDESQKRALHDHICKTRVIIR